MEWCSPVLCSRLVRSKSHGNYKDNLQCFPCLGCSCSFSYTLDKVTELVKFTKVNLAHTCSGSAKRRRGYPTDVIELVAPQSIKDFVPPSKGSSAVKQLTKTAKKAGMIIGPTVAAKLLTKIKGTDKMSAFREFEELPEYVAALKREDPTGEYVISSTDVPGDNRFESLMVVPGASIAQASTLRHNATIDGARVKTILGGCLLTAIALTANNGLVLLAFCYCFSETADAVTDFMAYVQRHYNMPLIFSDRGKAIAAALDEIAGLISRMCTQHIRKNVRETFAGTPQELLDSIYVMARCTTEDEFEKYVTFLKKEYPGHGKAIAYMYDLREQFVSAFFLPEHPSWTQITNNPAEEGFKFIDEARSLPVLTMLKKILTLFGTKSYNESVEANNRLEKYRESVTGDPNSRLGLVPKAVEWLEEIDVELPDNRVVTITLLTPTELQATVWFSSSWQAIVKFKRQHVNTAGANVPATLTCSMCRGRMDTGLMCKCALAAIGEANLRSSNRAGALWSIYDLAFADPSRRTETWASQYSNPWSIVPDVKKGATTGVSNPLKHWRFPPKRTGRRKKGETEATHGRKKRSRREYLCIGCGGDGHSVATCRNIDLDRVLMELERRSGGKTTSRRRARREANSTHATILDADLWGDDSSDSVYAMSESSSSESFEEDDDIATAIRLSAIAFQSRQAFATMLSSSGIALTEEQMMELAIKESLDLPRQNDVARDSILTAAEQMWKRTENMAVDRDGNCMFDAALHQMQLVAPDQVRGVTMQDVRQACADWCLSKYHDEDTSALQFYGFDCLADWYVAMSKPGYYGDELAFEALGNIYGGFHLQTLVGVSIGAAYLRTSGHEGRPQLFLGLLLDRHVMSLERSVDLANAQLQLGPVNLDTTTAPKVGLKKRVNFAFAEAPTVLPCCGLVKAASGISDTHACSRCRRVEHISCSKNKTTRRKAWECDDCKR